MQHVCIQIVTHSLTRTCTAHNERASMPLVLKTRRQGSFTHVIWFPLLRASECARLLHAVDDVRELIWTQRRNASVVGDARC